MIPWPKPVTGTSPQAIWLNQLLARARASEVTDVDGFNIEQTTAGRKLKKKYRPLLQPGQPTNVFYPFKIYQPSNLSDFVGKTAPMIAAFATGAPLQTCTIVASGIPTNLGANPQISIDDAWRFWSVRSGYIEYRPSYAAFYALLDNFATAMPVAYTDTPLGAYPADEYSFYFEAVGFDFTSTQTVNPPLVIGVDKNNEGEVSFGLWVSITEDTATTQASAQLCGYALSNELINGFQFDTLNRNMVPVGAVQVGGLSTGQVVIQFAYDHLRNRYPGGNGSWPSDVGNGTILNIRGSTQSNTTAGTSSALPADLGKQLFYPGDAMWYYQFTSGATTYNGIYIFTGQTPAFIQKDANGNPEPVSDSNWTLWGYEPIQPV